MAGPLRDEVVDRDATWVLHVDVERLRAGVIGRVLLEHPDIGGPIFTPLTESLGIDAMEHVRGLTFYSREDISTNTGAAIIELDPEAAGTLAQELPTRELDGFAIVGGEGGARYEWNCQGERWRLALRNLGQARLVVLCDDAKNLDASLRVLDGVRPNLSASKSIKPPEPVLDVREAHAGVNMPSHAELSWPVSDRASVANAGVVLLVRMQPDVSNARHVALSDYVAPAESTALPAENIAMCEVTDENPPPLRSACSGFVASLSEQRDDTGAAWATLRGTIRMANSESARAAGDHVRRMGTMFAGLIAPDKDPNAAAKHWRCSVNDRDVAVELSLDAASLRAMLESQLLGARGCQEGDGEAAPSATEK